MATEMDRLHSIMRALRDPDTGCPWDIEQTFESIAPYTIEEAYEVNDAIERGDLNDLKGELGDLLLQVVFHSQIATDRGAFDFNDVARDIADKMVHRHPHVFGDESRDKTAQQQVQDWEAIKATERANKAQKGTLDGVAHGLPALMRAVKLQKRAARVGFDWATTDDVLDKLNEEISELKDAKTQEHREEEFGDLLFVMANLARHMDIDAETALRAANAKFTRRFNGVERRLHAMGKTPQQSDLAEMDALWDAEKQAEQKI